MCSRAPQSPSSIAVSRTPTLRQPSSNGRIPRNSPFCSTRGAMPLVNEDDCENHSTPSTLLSHSRQRLSIEFRKNHGAHQLSFQIYPLWYDEYGSTKPNLSTPSPR